MKVLIIEDEKSLSDSVREYLKQEGYHCEAVYNYRDAMHSVDSYSYDCIIVDINLPDGTGLDVIRFIKKKALNVGIIIISGRNSLENRIEGLDIGADHYLTKPFHLAELNAHIKSIHRRIKFEGNNQIIVNEIKLLPDEHKAFIHEKELKLTRKEYELLLFFVSNKNKVITKIGLAEHLWGEYMDSAITLDFIYTHIKNLRRKLLKDGCKDYIQTIYGVGYKFEID